MILQLKHEHAVVKTEITKAHVQYPKNSLSQVKFYFISNDVWMYENQIFIYNGYQMHTYARRKEREGEREIDRSCEKQCFY